MNDEKTVVGQKQIISEKKKNICLTLVKQVNNINIKKISKLGKNLLLLQLGFDWERRKPIGIPPNFYLLLPCHHPKLLFGISNFLAQNEVGRSFLVFVL